MDTKLRSSLAIFSFIVCVLFFSVISFAPARAEEETKTVLRGQCYNIRHGQGMDGVVSLEKTAKTTKEWTPDPVAVQEVDKHTRRTNNADQPKVLAELLGMYHVFGKTIDVQRGEYGLLILSPFSIQNRIRENAQKQTA